MGRLTSSKRRTLSSNGYDAVRKVLLIAVALLALSGCSTASWLINPPPHVSDLYVTEDDVVAYFDRVSNLEPSDPDAVLYNPETDRYEVMAPAYKRGLTKSVMYEIQKEKIAEFSEDYERETFGGAVKKDAITFSLGAVLLLIGLVAIGVF